MTAGPRFPDCRAFRIAALLLGGLLWNSSHAASREDADLEFIPQQALTAAPAQPPEPAEASVYTIRVKADNLFSYVSWRDSRNLPLTVPSYDRSDWQNLTRLNVRGDFKLHPELSAHLDGLLNIYAYDDQSFKANQNIQFNVKEAYLSWAPSTSTFIDAGRINIKSGVAIGFNPTDYFKTNAVINQTTQDISQLRDNRLGTFSLRGQKLWDGGSVTVVAAPDMGNQKQRWYSDAGIYGLNMQKTNDRSRIMVKLSQRVAGNFSPEFIYALEGGNNNFGINLSHSVNDNLLLYAEWNLGQRRSLIDEAWQELRSTQRLMPQLQKLFPGDQGTKYRHQLAVGAAYTTAANITFNLEYHYNQAGLSESDWQRWFQAGQAAQGNPAITGPLLAVRTLGLARLEPANRHTLFLRSQWRNAFMNNLDLSGLFIMDMADQSSLLQGELAYNFNSQSSASLRVAGFNGDSRSNYGSVFTNLSAILQYNYNF